MPSPRLLLLGLALVVAAVLLSEGVAGVRSDYALGIAFVVQPEQRQPTVRVGRLGFDPSTSERLAAMGAAVEGWLRRPSARTLVETRALGFAAFAALLWAVLRSGLASYRQLRDPDGRGLALGFVAGVVGLIFHAVGANTFIIVRIMEPFWFFAGVVIALPALREAEAPAVPGPRTPALGYPA